MANNQLSPYSPQLLRLPAVKARVGLCRSSIYARIAAGSFPSPVKLGARAVAWDSRAIDTWIAERLGQYSIGDGPVS